MMIFLGEQCIRLNILDEMMYFSNNIFSGSVFLHKVKYVSRSGLGKIGL